MSNPLFAAAWRWSAVFLSTALLSGVASTAPMTARAQLDQFSAGLQTLSGQFEQRTQSGGQTESASGTLALKAPRLFRWDYLDPFEQRIVADGDHVWVYDIDLEQVSVRPQSFDEASSPLAVLMDLKQLDVEFAVSDGGHGEGLDWLVLKSKSKEPQFKEARLGFAGNQLQAMRVIDSFEGRIDYRFSDWQRNQSLPSEHFVFKVPEGVDVIGETRAGAQVQPLGD